MSNSLLSEYKPSCCFKLSNLRDLTTAFCISFNHKISTDSYSSILSGPTSFSLVSFDLVLRRNRSTKVVTLIRCLKSPNLLGSNTLNRFGILLPQLVPGGALDPCLGIGVPLGV